MIPQAHELANEIFMSPSFQVHLVVEGDSDYALFKQHIIPPRKINILPAHGSENVLACMDFVEAVKSDPKKNNNANVHYFIDRDYRFILSSIAETKELTATSLKDLECEFFSTDAFNSVALEFICDKKLAAAKIDSKTFIELILQAASIIGALRFSIEKSKTTSKSAPSLSLQDLNPSKFFDPKTLKIDNKKFAAHIGGKNQWAVVTEKTILDSAALASKEVTLSDPFHLCSGHDIAMLLAAAAKGHWKPKNYPSPIETESTEALARSFYKPHARFSRFYKRIYDWCFVVTGSSEILSAPLP